MVHAADHADLPDPVLDLGAPVANEAVLAVAPGPSGVDLVEGQRRGQVSVGVYGLLQGGAAR